ncbi:MAG TPA: hypothetical protein VHA12_02725 [Candidatus Nanoarchaeia archaeon]|nr:hypothetical protein [Candidatus Nanoarchaeia archaeon]
MKWKTINANGKPFLYEEEGGRFSIEPLGGVAYLHDMRKSKVPYPTFIFDSVKAAKKAAKEAMKGEKLASNTKDPFEGLADVIKKAGEYLKLLKNE